MQQFTVLTTDESIKQLPEYEVVYNTIDRLIVSGIIHMSARHCISASDMIYISLLQQGIKSHLVECQLTLSYLDKSPTEFNYIGFDNIKNPGELDTHMVCITDTNPPMLIDTSISHVLPQGYVAVIARADSDSNRIIASYTSSLLGLVYQSKLIQKVPLAHQTSILNRIKTDNRIFKEINLLKKLNYIGIAVSAFALVNVVLKIVGVY